MNEEVLDELLRVASKQVVWCSDSIEQRQEPLAREDFREYAHLICHLFPKTEKNPGGYEVPKGGKCVLGFSFAAGKWIAPEGFIKDGEDGCEREICGFSTCHNYGKPFVESDRIVIPEPKPEEERYKDKDYTVPHPEIYMTPEELGPDRFLTREEIQRAIDGLEHQGIIYCAEVITGYQDIKTASILEQKCEVCADGFIGTHEKATAYYAEMMKVAIDKVRDKKDAEKQEAIGQERDRIIKYLRETYGNVGTNASRQMAYKIAKQMALDLVLTDFIPKEKHVGKEE